MNRVDRPCSPSRAVPYPFLSSTDGDCAEVRPGVPELLGHPPSHPNIYLPTAHQTHTSHPPDGDCPVSGVRPGVPGLLGRRHGAHHVAPHAGRGAGTLPVLQAARFLQLA